MRTETLLLASNNEHKHVEFSRLFPDRRILRPAEIGVGFEFEENGDTFLANALGKAMELFRLAGRPVIADDSGLCVRALGGEPGVRSARYGATAETGVLNAPQRNLRLLARLEGVSDRAAMFVCCLVLVLEENRFFVAQETVHGLIADGPRGEGGFGYDPLFLLPDRGMTVAELPDAEKDRLSHRGRAAGRIQRVLEELERAP